jgi:7-carboxy-7-deazaguanine synthase
MILTIFEIESCICNCGKFAGYPTTHVRLQGCNLDCTYCTKKAKKSRSRMSVQTILGAVMKMGNEHIVITGGEPLLQESIYVLVYELVDRGYQIMIETNGSIKLDETLYKRSYGYSVNIKCPSSGMSNRNNYNNLEKLLSHDEVRVIVKDLEDYVFAKEIIKKYRTKANLVFIPLDNNISKQLSSWILEDKLARARVCLPIE